MPDNAVWTGRFATELGDRVSDWDDPAGYFKDVRPAPPDRPEDAEPAENRFLEIAAFREETGREPRLDADDFCERGLARTLDGFRRDPLLRVQLQPLDEFGLLDSPPAETPAPAGRQEKPKLASGSLLARLAADDPAGLLAGVEPAPPLDDEGRAALDLNGLPSAEDRMAESLRSDILSAQRVQCQDYDRFKPQFDAVRAMIDRRQVVFEKRRRTVVEIGGWYYLRNRIHWAAERAPEGDGTPGPNGEPNPRLRLICDSGTEVHILARSLQSAMSRDKYSFVLRFPAESAPAGPAPKIGMRGRVYCVSSLSDAPELQELRRAGTLVKIGYTTQTLDDRIAHAEAEETYLCAPVQKIAEFECLGVDPLLFEKLVHQALSLWRLNLVMISPEGRQYRPQEWFAVTPEEACGVCRSLACRLNEAAAKHAEQARQA